ncbi:MAG: tRNA (adenosine(37)-N6)-threonylcarbamoyltransferase complex dimerization subunit type 1 TsaB [Pseudonocardia sp.]|nr:tRNA (adenosine(37)-N6)-threonylcarbamoyltransferase complex dimerization subunit type 1 TsaB [Pseudonocardia sp.]
MIVLALDTATPAVTAGVVDRTDDSVVERSVHVVHDPRKHAELLMPGVLVACAAAGVALPEVEAVVVGAGPGPFTGLRVGMVTAAALGDALGVPVHAVCTLDAIAADVVAAEVVAAEVVAAEVVAAEVVVADMVAADAGGPLLVVTDARRREVYWAAYDASGVRVDGPHVESPAALAERGLPVAAAAGGSAAGLGWPVREPAAPSPRGLVAVAAQALRAGVEPGPLEPLYLRRPDAVEPGARKKVSTG